MDNGTRIREKKPGGKNGSGKKWKESLVSFGKDGKKPGVFFLGWKHIKINDEVKLTDYFNRLPFQSYDLRMFFWYLEFIFLVQFIFIKIEYKSMYNLLCSFRGCFEIMSGYH